MAKRRRRAVLYELGLQKCIYLCSVFLLFYQKVDALGQNPLLLYSTSVDIRIANTSRPIKPATIVKGLQQGHATDFYSKGKLVCWSDHGLEMIECATYQNSSDFTLGEKFTIASDDYITPNGIAVDWVTENIYWTDEEQNRIEVASIYKKTRKVLFWTDIDYIRAIAVVPEKGLLFWTDWGEVPKIERAGMNGDPKTRKVIVKDNILWPNGLTIDYNRNLIYWLDANKKFIDVMDFEGNNRKQVVKGLVYPFALTFFDEKLYWTDWKKWSLYSWDLTTNGPIKDLVKSEPAPVDIRVFDSKRQPEPRTPSPCSFNNGNCSHLCLLQPDPPGYTCACSTGIKMRENSSTQCEDRPQALLIVAQRNGISKISLDTLDYTPKKLNRLKGVKRAIAVDYDAERDFVYWADSNAKCISRSHLDGSGQEAVIEPGTITPESIAIDLSAQNIYWTDPQADTISVARIGTGYIKVLIFEDIFSPRAIALHPKAGWMFWSDWYEKRPKIERASLDGSDRKVLVSTNLAWPNGIALDTKSNYLYWGDGKTHKIELCDMNGNNRRELHSDDILHIFGLSLIGNYVYWTDIQSRCLERVNKITGGERETIVDQMPDIFGVKAVSMNVSVELTSCSINNNDCTHLCFNTPNATICGCPLGLELAPDQKSCIEPEVFLIYGRKNEIGRIGIENQNNNAVIPIKELKEVSALAIHILDNKIYWADGKVKAIFRCALNGTQVEKIIDWAGIVEGLAVDWSAQNLYWTDSALNRIEVSRLDGSSRKAIIWRGLKKPKNIALEIKKGLMFWSEIGSKSIKRAGMDGSSPTIIVEQVPRVTSLLASNGRIWWGSLEPPGVESCDYDGRNKKRYSSAPATAIALTNNNVIWADFTNGNVETTSKTSQNTQSTDIITRNLEYVTSLLTYNKNSQNVMNQCSVDNGGCDSLCLANPNGFVCACATHYTLKKDNLTCQEPEEYLLYFQKSTMGRIMLNTTDCPDTTLPLPLMKNPKSIDYDPIERMLYWVEEDSGIVRKALAGTNMAQPGSESTLDGTRDAVRVALDTIGRALYYTTQDGAIEAISLLMPKEQPSNISFKSATASSAISTLIALHPSRRLLVWIDVVERKLIRAAVDGTGRRQMANVTNATSLTIDTRRDVIYWSTGTQINAIDLDGANQRVIHHNGGSPASSLSIVENNLFFIGPEKTVHMISIDRSSHMDHEFDAHMPRAQTLLAVHPVDREDVCYAGGACGSSVGSCLAEGTCGCGPACAQHTCPQGYIPCHTANNQKERCIPAPWRCDFQKDCADGSDELDCGECPHGVRCTDGECVGSLAQCVAGALCAAHHYPGAFRCNRLCLSANLLCDGITHCEDGSDERDCTAPVTPELSKRAPGPALLAAALAAALCLGGWVAWVSRKRLKNRSGNPTDANANQASDIQMRPRLRQTVPSPKDISTSSTHLPLTSRTPTPRDPPPSPASARRNPYRHYRAMNRPPPPTPCSTSASACESEYFRRTPAPPPPPSPASTYRDGTSTPLFDSGHY